MGVASGYAAVPMNAAHSAGAAALLRKAMLQRQPVSSSGGGGGGGGGGGAASFTGRDQQCICKSSTVTVDADFVAVQTPSELVLERTSDVPFIYHEKSSIQCCLAARTVFSLVATTAAVGAYHAYLDLSNPDALQKLIAYAVFCLVNSLLSSCHVISFASLASCCCRFTLVTVGTQGAARGEGSAGAACCGCCCGKRAPRKYYMCNDSGPVAEAFARRARAAISASLAADKASCSGAQK
jgi:hypothetical protein